MTSVFLSRPLFLRFPDQDLVRMPTKRFFQPGGSATQACAQIRKQFHGKRKIKLAFKPDWHLTQGFLPLAIQRSARSVMQDTHPEPISCQACLLCPGERKQEGTELLLVCRPSESYRVLARVPRAIHLTHPASAERRTNSIRAKFCTCGKRHSPATFPFRRPSSK